MSPSRMRMVFNDRASVSRPSAPTRRIHRGTRVNPQVYSLPYARRAQLTFHSVPMSVRAIAGDKIGKLLNKRRILNNKIVEKAARTRSQVLSNVSLAELKSKRNEVNRKIARLRAVANRASYVPSMMAPNLLRV